MSITINGRPGQRLEVTGDVSTELRVPFDDADERFFVAASDGTLIEGRLIADDDRYDFRVAVEGAGVVRVGRGELTMDWRVEWVTIAPYKAGVLVEHGVEPLPLFELLG